MKKKEYVRKDGTLDRIQYLRDLYRIIQNYLGELRDDDPIQLLIKRMEKMENKNEETIKFKDLEDMVFNFFNDLRFSDGTKVEDRIHEVSSDGSQDRHSESEEYDEDGDIKDILLDNVPHN